MNREFLCNVEEISLDVKGDSRGKLVVFQRDNNIPFDIKRVFYIYGTQNDKSRGYHAHSVTRELLVATSGSVIVNCEWKNKKQSFILDSPDKGLLIDGMVWHTMDNFTSDCVLMVLADTYYDEADYIRDYDVFLKEANNA